MEISTLKGLSAAGILAALLVSPGAAQAEIKVVASIKPVHSLAASVMGKTGAPKLILQGAATPHAHALRPSQAAMLSEADVVFWLGEELETFLAKPLRTIASKAKAVSLLKAPGLTKLPLRGGEEFAHHHHDHGHGHEKHDDDEKHDDHGHEKHGDKHGHDKKHDDHGHEKHDHDKKHDDHGHEKHGDKHDDEGFDAHVWLDPDNAAAIVRAIQKALSAADPAQSAVYAANAKKTIERLTTLETEIANQIAPVGKKPFMVFHDAYQYFEKRFGLKAVGSLTVSPEIAPGAKRVRKIQARLKAANAACVFSEPQFKPKIVAIVTQGTNARSGVLDPLGATIKDGPDLYFQLIQNMAGAFRTCLSGAS